VQVDRRTIWEVSLIRRTSENTPLPDAESRFTYLLQDIWDIVKIPVAVMAAGTIYGLVRLFKGGKSSFVAVFFSTHSLTDRFRGLERDPSDLPEFGNGQL